MKIIDRRDEQLFRGPERIATLRRELHRHNQLYHVAGTPEITDAQFDELLKELAALEAQHPVCADVNSPTARIGSGSLGSFEKVKHSTPMLSLDKVFTAEELLKWWKATSAHYSLSAQRVLSIEPKIDGLALALRYSDGELVQAITRGPDGVEGDDVTANARTIATIPLKLGHPWTCEVRGEVYMSKASFAVNNDRAEQEGDEPFANPRNAAVGTMKSQDPRVVAERKLSFVAYRALRDDPRELAGQPELSFLAAMGFVTTETLCRKVGLDPWLFMHAPLTEAFAKVALATWQAQLEKLEVETDGVVFKYISPGTRAALGQGTKTIKWGVAYKFPPKRVPTKLLDIELSVGRTGIVIPNARLAPVVICGTTVSNASLCNQDEVARLGICVGDTVFVEKSGEIIPKVVGIAATCDGSRVPDYGSREAQERAWKFPQSYEDTRAGCLGSFCELTREVGAAHYRLKQPEKCWDCLHAQLVHAVGKNALDWDGCGPAQIDTLMANDVRDLPHLMVVDPKEGGLEGVAAIKFIESREAVKRRPLWRFLVALGAEGIGTTYCKQLASIGRNWRDTLAIPQWRVVELLGDVRGAAFDSSREWLRRALRQLESYGCVLDDDKLVSTGAKQSLKGLVFCVTGVLSKSRDEVHELIEAAGGLAKTSCTKATNYLIVGEDPGASKLKAAEKNKTTKVITENQLYELMQK